MTHSDEYTLVQEILAAAERNERLARAIQSARREILIMALVVAILAGIEAYQVLPYGIAVIAGFVIGWLSRTLLNRRKML